MKKLLNVLFILVLIFLPVFIFAATDSTSHTVTMNVIEIALIDLNSTAAITLETNAPAMGGGLPTGDIDSSKLLQYTSLVTAGAMRNITAAWGATDAAPAGTSLKLEATSVPAGAGTAAGQITISNVAANLITNIGSCATGTGADGAALTYTFSIDTVGLLVVGDNKTITITFTLTDAV